MAWSLCEPAEDGCLAHLQNTAPSEARPADGVPSAWGLEPLTHPNSKVPEVQHAMWMLRIPRICGVICLRREEALE